MRYTRDTAESRTRPYTVTRAFVFALASAKTAQGVRRGERASGSGERALPDHHDDDVHVLFLLLVYDKKCVLLAMETSSGIRRTTA